MLHFNLSRHFIIHCMVDAKCSSNCIIEDLREVGIAYRRADMLRDIRKIRATHAIR